MILLTGGSGLLGQELQKHMEFFAPPHSDFDILHPPALRNFDMIVHCAAYTDVAKAERDMKNCFDVNVLGTANIARLGVPVVYISTEYIFDGRKGNYREDDKPNPKNYYAMTKWLGEFALLDNPKTLTIRTVFKPRPFKHPSACTDQWTSGDYVDVIAPRIIKAIEWFMGAEHGNHTLNIGTGRKSVYELAAQSVPDVGQITRKEVKVKLPKDTSLDLSKWESLIGQDR